MQLKFIKIILKNGCICWKLFQGTCLDYKTSSTFIINFESELKSLFTYRINNFEKCMRECTHFGYNLDGKVICMYRNRRT